ncbi:hypothetical protein NIES2104_67610 [Leptolyngbya sp. NIES-2104]|nr:hypothetical protein NIES2104_67610 [Leptolyngbya sp. NIES-2104]
MPTSQNFFESTFRLARKSEVRRGLGEIATICKGFVCEEKQSLRLKQH